MFTTQELQVVEQASAILKSKLITNNAFTSSSATKDFCRFSIANKEYEAFGMLLLTSQHTLIEDLVMFRGTVDSTSVYPREVLKEALRFNAAAVIFYHNHPSGNVRPSEGDKRITQKLQNTLSLVDIKVLDHIIVGLDTTFSFAEKGLL